MNRIILLFVFFCFQSAVCHGRNGAEQKSFLSWFVFAGGIEVIDGSTILIVANGINKKINLQGVCSTGTEQKDKQAERLVRQFIDGKRSEIKIYGENKQQIDSAVLFIDSININQELIKKGYVSTGKECWPVITSNKKINTMQDSLHVDQSLPSSSSYGFDIFYIGGVENDPVQNYYRKDKKHVQTLNRPVSRQYSPSSYSSRPKPVHVRGYYRKNGTYVQSHRRSAPRYR